MDEKQKSTRKPHISFIIMSTCDSFVLGNTFFFFFFCYQNLMSNFKGFNLSYFIKPAILKKNSGFLLHEICAQTISTSKAYCLLANFHIT